ncbi:MAG: YeeE/YedE family protein, partial [Bdellovibrionaceae bacterium]|nr:YeeE/YedE family protein [Pseudobdellovibrionaceae bacterium]
MTIHNRNAIAAYVVGLVFALGLGLSGMTQPQKVLGFLDLFGHWDPSLIFVMGGAVGVHFITYRLIRRRPSPLFDTKWHVPTSR